MNDNDTLNRYGTLKRSYVWYNWIWTSKSINIIIKKLILLFGVLMIFGVPTLRAQNCISVTPYVGAPILNCCNGPIFVLHNNCGCCITAIKLIVPMATLTACGEIDDPTHATWVGTANSDGSVTLKPSPGNGCWGSKALIVRLCGTSSGTTVNYVYTCNGTDYTGVFMIP
jgi:hypothetical protein